MRAKTARRDARLLALESFLFGVTATDPSTFVIAAALLMTATAAYVLEAAALQITNFLRLRASAE